MTTATISPSELEQRFDAAISNPGVEAFEPTPFGEGLMWHLVALVCKTAPEGKIGVRAYAALEHSDLDEIVGDLRETVVRHVHRAIAS